MRLSIVALSSFLLATKRRSVVVEGHFLFARVDEEEKKVKVFFSEPVAMEGKAVSYVKDRVNEMTMVGPKGRTTTIGLRYGGDDDGDGDEDHGYLWGDLPDALDNVPYFITGFLDYGAFGEGDGPKKDLQYTYSAQLSSTNPNDDFSHFVHSTMGTDPESPHDVDVDPFAVALKNFGPPYRAVVRGVGPTTLVRVCIYDGNDSHEKVGCVEGVHNRTHHLTFDDEEIGVLRPCGTYFALANTTKPAVEGVRSEETNSWSSSSVVWNGPCSKYGDGGFRVPRRPVAKWYEDFRFFGRPRGGTGNDASASSSSSGSSLFSSERNEVIALHLVFLSGLAAGALLFHVVARCRSRRAKGGKHAKIESAAAEEDEMTAKYSDDASSSELT